MHQQYRAMYRLPASGRAETPPFEKWPYNVVTSDSGGDSGDDDEGYYEDAGPPRKRSKTRAGSFVERSGSTSPTSSHTASEGPLTAESQSAADAAAKARKPTYVLQKEERDGLVAQVRLLEARLELLKLRAGLPTINDENSVANIQAKSFDVEEEIHRNILKLARFQSLITRQLQTTPVCPMKTFIRMPTDAQQRKAMLEDMKEFKLRRAAEVAMDRLHYLDPFKPYVQEERYATPDGLNHMKFFQIQQFEGLSSARVLYDALVYFYEHLETSVTDMVGQLTLRKDSEVSDPSVWNHHIVTTGECGGAEEINLVGFSKFYDSYMPHNGAQFGILALDTVDEDELYPYKPTERTHKDYQAAFAVCEYRKPETNELVVVLKTCAFMIQPPPQFDLPAVAFEKLLENMPRWFFVMNKFLADSTAASAGKEPAAP